MADYIGEGVSNKLADQVSTSFLVKQRYQGPFQCTDTLPTFVTAEGYRAVQLG